MFDANSDGRVTMQELVAIAKIKVLNYKPGHKQIHLGLTDRDGEMQVIWVSNPEHYEKPVVEFGHFPTRLDQRAQAVISTYNVGHLGFHGKIYKAVMSGLKPRQRYYYRVGDEVTNTFSVVKYYQSPPDKGTELP